MEDVELDAECIVKVEHEFKEELADDLHCKNEDSPNTVDIKPSLDLNFDIKQEGNENEEEEDQDTEMEVKPPLAVFLQPDEDAVKRENIFQTASKKRERQVTHAVQEYFNYHQETNESICLNASCKVRKIPGRHSGNLSKHLKVHHPESFKRMQAETSDRIRQNLPKPKRAKAKHLNGVEMNGQKLQLQCIRLVTEHGHAFSLLDDDAFQEIIQPMIVALPASERVVINSTTSTAQIHTYAAKIREAIALETRRRLLCLKVDATSRNHRHFLGVNIQFIDKGQVIIRTLGVTELTAKHSAANIKMEVEMLLTKYGIAPENVISFTTDNGTNMLKAAKLLKEAVAIEEEEKEWEEDDPCPEVVIATQQTTLQSVRCAAHTLQLAIDDAVKITSSVRGVLWDELLGRCRTLAKYLRTPRITRVLNREKVALPTLDVPTGWGSTFDMLQSLRKLKDVTEHVLVGEEKNCNLEEKDWQAVDEIIAALAPARYTTTALQEDSLLLSDFFGLWTKCKLRLSIIAEDSEGQLASNLKRCMEDRERGTTYKHGGEKSTPLLGYPGFKAALLMDPRYFSILEPEDVADAKVYLLGLWSRLQKLNDEDQVANEEAAVDDPSSNEQDDDDSEDELEALLARKNARRCSELISSVPQRIIRALDSYFHTTKRLKTKENVLQYWEGERFAHPELYLLATSVLAIPATQVSVERLFSSLRYVLNPLRYRLSSEHVEDVMLLHSNAELLRRLEPDILDNESHVCFSNSPTEASSSFSSSTCIREYSSSSME